MTDQRLSVALDSPNLAVIRMEGTIDAIAMEVALNELVPVMKDMDHGGMILWAENVDWPTLGAIGVELRHWGQLMAMLRKVDKVAVMTEKVWVRNLAAVESLLIPNLEIHSFHPWEEDKARAWLAGAD